jgi:hypothetical protein
MVPGSCSPVFIRVQKRIDVSQYYEKLLNKKKKTAAAASTFYSTIDWSPLLRPASPV